MANSADPDQLASDLYLHCLQRQDISGFSRTRVKNIWYFEIFFKIFQRKQVLIFHVNRLLAWQTIHMKYQDLFSFKN